MLRDQLVEQAWLPAVRDRILLEDELTLEKAVNLACQFESAVCNASLLSDTDASGSQSQSVVQAVSANKGQWKCHKPRTEQFKRRKDSRVLKQINIATAVDHVIANDRNYPATSESCRAKM